MPGFRVEIPPKPRKDTPRWFAYYGSSQSRIHGRVTFRTKEVAIHCMWAGSGLYGLHREDEDTPHSKEWKLVAKERGGYKSASPGKKPSESQKQQKRAEAKRKARSPESEKRKRAVHARGGTKLRRKKTLKKAARKSSKA